MDVVFSLADRISVLVQGRVIASGAAEAIRNDPLVREAYLGEDDDAARLRRSRRATARARSCSASSSRCGAARS